MSIESINAFERASKLKIPELCSLPIRDVESLVVDFTDSEIKHILRDDPFMKNYVLSMWEKLNHKTVLETYPWDQIISVVDFCNAKCGICMSWLKTDGFLSLGDLPMFDNLFSYAKKLTLTGGEPTAHPNFGELIQYIAGKVDLRGTIYLTTNGSKLDRYYDQLKDIGNLKIICSLNAATSETHHQLMKLSPGSFERILDSIRFFRSNKTFIIVSMVVTGENLAEIPAFIDLCHDLDVNSIMLRNIAPETGTVPLPDNSGSFFPAYNHSDFHKLVADARKAIERSTIFINSAPDQWSIELPPITKQSEADVKNSIDTFRRSHNETIVTRGDPMSAEERCNDHALVDMGDPHNRVTPFSCNRAYYSTVIYDKHLALIPCCFMDGVPGYKKMGLLTSRDFFELWNLPAYVGLRRSFRDGQLYPKCKVCPYPNEPGAT